MSYENIHSFASKWFDIFNDKNTTAYDITTNPAFLNEATFLGFNKNCMQSFMTIFPGDKIFNDWHALDDVIDSINDVELLGSAIFFKWGYFAYWAGTEENILEEHQRLWFLTALGRLEQLTSEEDESDFFFEGTLKKTTLCSHITKHGITPEEDEETEQYLTLACDRKISFSTHCYRNDMDIKNESNHEFTIDQKVCDNLMLRVQEYFSSDYMMLSANDPASWNLVLTNTHGKKWEYEGKLFAFDNQMNKLSELFRQSLHMPDLFMFSMREPLDPINRFKIDYHRINKIRIENDDNSDEEIIVKDYSESIVIDRASQTLTYTQIPGNDCKITHEYYIKNKISSLLEQLNKPFLFEPNEDNVDDMMPDPLRTEDYVIDIDFEHTGRYTVTGTFDSDGLPQDFPQEIAIIQRFIKSYGLDEIFNPSNYQKKRSTKETLIFCNVVFPYSEKTYCYLTNDDSIHKGDRIVVPVGYRNEETIVVVDSIEYRVAEDAPYPVDKMKRVLRKYEENGES